MQVVVDRLVVRADHKQRIVDSLEQAFRFGKGRLALFSAAGRLAPRALQQSPRLPALRHRLPRADANLFSFNSPLGACETCRGFGRVIDVDLDLVIPDPGKTLADGAIKPWSNRNAPNAARLLDFCERKKIPTDGPGAS